MPFTNPALPPARFSTLVFRAAGIVGLIEILPLYFAEKQLAATTGPLTYPEVYYGFLGVVVAWQVAFLIISRDPRRYHSLLPALILEKLLYPISAFYLYSQGRVKSVGPAIGSSIDLVLLVLFVAAWVRDRDVMHNDGLEHLMLPY